MSVNISEELNATINSVLAVHPDYVYPSNGTDDEKQASLELFDKYLIEIELPSISTMNISRKNILKGLLFRKFKSVSENVAPVEQTKSSKAKPKVENKSKPKKTEPKAKTSKADNKAKPKAKPKVEQKVENETNEAEQNESNENETEAETKDEPENVITRAIKRIQKNKPKKEAPAKPIKVDNLLHFEEPTFEAVSRDDELNNSIDIIKALTDTFDFDKGKRIMKTKKVENVENDTKSKDEHKAEDIQLLKDTIDSFKDSYEALYSAVNDFKDSYEDGTLKVSEDKIRIAYSKAKTSKDNKKDDVAFEDTELLTCFRDLQTNLYKFISKDFLANHYIDVLKSGIINSRSIIKSSCFSTIAGLDKLGILSKININICDSEPTIKIKLLKDNEYKYLNDYYWIVNNANYTSKKTTKASDIFERRNAIINHQRYHEINTTDLWNQARENIENNTSELGSIWKDILNSKYMYYIIIYGLEMNPFVYPCFKKFINESSELFKDELLSISFLFTCFCMGPVNSNSLENELDSNMNLYDYNSFSIAYKVLDGLDESKSVIDVVTDDESD